MKHPKIAKQSGFTLIELMIVVAIIAIVASIAIPNLLQSRMQANETNAIGALKIYAAAQGIFKKANYAANNGMQTKQYCDDLQNLYSGTNAGGDMIELIPEPLARADDSGGAMPYQGYLFQDDALPLPPAPESWQDNFGLFAYPSTYGKTGVNSYCIHGSAMVYQKDTGQGAGGIVPGAPFDPVAAGWVNP